MTNENLLLKIRSMLPCMTEVEQKLGNFILEHPGETIGLSTKELALRCGVSEAALVRFSRKLGLSGYTDLKLKLSAGLGQQEDVSFPIDLQEEDTPPQIYRKLAQLTATSIEATYDTLGTEALDQAIDLIVSTHANGGNIYICGSGASSLLAREMQMKMSHLTIPTIYFEDAHLQLTSVMNIRPGDLLISFTMLGRSVQTRQYMEIARKQGARILLFTQYGNQRLASLADVTLFAAPVENAFRFSASETSLVIYSVIIETVFLGLSLRNRDEMMQNSREVQAAFEKYGYRAGKRIPAKNKG